VAILRALLDRGGCLCGDLVELLPLSQSTVSEHLRVLRTAGLVYGERDGPRCCYCVDLRGLRLLKELVARL
jgi:ArsR family transcriptional regulator